MWEAQSLVQETITNRKEVYVMSFLDNARRAFKSKSDEFFDDSEYEQEYEEYEDEPRKPLFSFLSKKADE